MSDIARRAIRDEVVKRDEKIRELEAEVERLNKRIANPPIHIFDEAGMRTYIHEG